MEVMSSSPERKTHALCVQQQCSNARTLGPVVPGPRGARQDVVGLVELARGAGADVVDGGGLHVHEHGAIFGVERGGWFDERGGLLFCVLGGGGGGGYAQGDPLIPPAQRQRAVHTFTEGGTKTIGRRRTHARTTILGERHENTG